jgi:hypothetical protein
MCSWRPFGKELLNVSVLCVFSRASHRTFEPDSMMAGCCVKLKVKLVELVVMAF